MFDKMFDKVKNYFLNFNLCKPKPLSPQYRKNRYLVNTAIYDIKDEEDKIINFVKIRVEAGEQDMMGLAIDLKTNFNWKENPLITIYPEDTEYGKKYTITIC